jgi:hypothetical protein
LSKDFCRQAAPLRLISQVSIGGGYLSLNKNYRASIHSKVCAIAPLRLIFLIPIPYFLEHDKAGLNQCTIAIIKLSILIESLKTFSILPL